MQFVSPQTYGEAIAKLGARSPVASTLTSTDWQSAPVALRERAFWSSRIESVRFLSRAQSALTDFLTGARETLPNGQTALKTGSRAAFVAQMQKFALREGMGPLDPKDKGGIKDITSEPRLGLIFDTQTKAAHDFGNWKQGMDAAVLDEFPAQRFIRVRAVKKARPYHRVNEGVVRLKTDTAFWLRMNPDFSVPWGPWGYNSGMDVEDVDRAEAERLGLLNPGERVKPVDRQFNDDLSASLRGLPDAYVDILKGVFGPDIQINGDEIRWKGAAEPIAAKPASLADALAKVGLDGGRPATPQQMSTLLGEMREVNPIRMEDRTASWDESALGAAPNADLARDKIMAHAQELLDMVPRAMAQRLPPIDWIIDPVADFSGEYNPYTGKLTLSVAGLAGKPDWFIKTTIWHELTHWLHFHGPDAYRQAIADHFRARTTLPNGQMEPVQQLPGFAAGTLGQRDDGWIGGDYTGRRYDPPYYDAPHDQPGWGVEVPSQTVETLLASPADLARLWNVPRHQETLRTVLQIFFPMTP